MAHNPFFAPSLNASTTGAGTPVDCSQVRDITAWVIGSGTISTGTLIFEEAYYNAGWESGNAPSVSTPTVWSQLPNASIACTEVTTGAQKAYQLPPGKYAYVRPRLSAAVTGGGSITVVFGGI